MGGEIIVESALGQGATFSFRIPGAVVLIEESADASDKEIEVLANARGKPVVLLHGRAIRRANTIGMREIEISLTHERDLACAMVVGGSGVPVS